MRTFIENLLILTDYRPVSSNIICIHIFFDDIPNLLKFLHIQYSCFWQQTFDDCNIKLHGFFKEKPQVNENMEFSGC